MVTACLKIGVRAGRLGQRIGALLAPSGRQSTAEEYAMLVGPIFARLFYDRAEVTSEFIGAVVSMWLAAVERRYDHCEQSG